LCAVKKSCTKRSGHLQSLELSSGDGGRCGLGTLGSRASIVRGALVPVDAVSLDEVGLWFELTAAGRERICASPGQEEPDWSLEVDDKANTITIYGKDEAVIDA
jgi:hypothetical protein